MWTLFRELASRWRARRERLLFPERTVQVSIDPDGVTLIAPAQNPQTLLWSALQSVQVQTTDTGPFSEDVFIHLVGADQRLSIPQLATGADALYDRLAELPGFDHRASIEAMSSTSNAVWTLWRKPLSEWKKSNV